MSAVGHRLKELRLSAKPSLSIRSMADALEMPHASYNFYERESYKKPHLPIDLARRIAAVLASRGVDPAEVMKLAGLAEDETEPEVVAIEARRPAIRFATMQVALPNEAALTEMFQSLLALIPQDASRAEAAKILAQQLPAGFAAIGPLLLDPGNDATAAPTPAGQSAGKGSHAPSR